MGQRAVEECAADWVIDAQVDEFWLPRAESIKDVLTAIPSRYDIVQALTRVFLPRADGAEPWQDRLTIRRTGVGPSADESAFRLDRALRPICRVVEGFVPIGAREVVLAGRAPLRAWYPIEVLRFPLRSSLQARRHVAGRSGSTLPRSDVEELLFGGANAADALLAWDDVVIADDGIEPAIASGTCVRDERLRNALERIEEPGTAHRGYALPGGESDGLALGTPSVVDDMAYAEECAAVREVDLDSVRKTVHGLEERIAFLEQKFWPRVARGLSRVVRR
jgi:hypothetical protein